MPQTPPDDGLTPPGPGIEEPTADQPTDAGRPTTWHPSAWGEVGQAPAYGRFGGRGDRFEPPPSKKMAGWALALSLLFCIPFGFVVAIGLAIAVLVKSRDGRDHGKGMAIAALIISGLIVAANVVYVVMVLVTGYDGTERDNDGQVLESGEITPDRLRVGDCYNDPSIETARRDELGDAAAHVEAVPCAEPHQAEVFHLIEMEDGEFPGRAAVDARSDDCGPALIDYVGQRSRLRGFGLYYLMPSEVTWRFGDRTIVCSIVHPDSSTGSVARARR